METNASRQSAVILSFPTGGRQDASKLGWKAKFAAEERAVRALKVLPETGWYHQDALESEAAGQKH